MNVPALAPGLSVAQARRDIAERFHRHGLDTPDLDARADRRPRARPRPCGADQARLIAAGGGRCHPAARRRGGAPPHPEPVARITATKEFWSLPLRVTPAVLVPRPETETVVEATLSVIARSGALRVADLGTGSGAILLALLSELPGAAASAPIAIPARSRSRAPTRRTSGWPGARISWRATSGPRSRADATSWCPIRPISRPPTSRRWRRTCGISTRCSRSTAAATASRPIGRSRPTPGACSRRADGSWWRSGSDKPQR